MSTARERRKVYNTARWRNLRLYMLRQAGWKCCECGQRHTPSRLEVHHIVPIKSGGAVFAAANLRILCKACHKQHHNDYVRRPSRRMQWLAAFERARSKPESV